MLRISVLQNITSHFLFLCRKIPWINIYAQVQHDKEQEMIGSVSQSENAPKITLSEFTDPEELMDKELDTRVMGEREPSAEFFHSLGEGVGLLGIRRGSDCDPGTSRALRH